MTAMTKTPSKFGLIDFIGSLVAIGLLYLAATIAVRWVGLGLIERFLGEDTADQIAKIFLL